MELSHSFELYFQKIGRVLKRNVQAIKADSMLIVLGLTVLLKVFGHKPWAKRIIQSVANLSKKKTDVQLFTADHPK
ncbi:MAG: hypothetical protein EOP04_09275 [Proteobacteria bacterium]|nr:MAG: hypothetical protein EOP04_09275 [Pseudomonadota bacterium]